MPEGPPEGRVRVVLELLPGLDGFVVDELLATVPGAQVISQGEDEIEAEVGEGDIEAVLALRTAVAALLVLRFPVPRPRSLLSPDVMGAIVEAVAGIRRRRASGPFGSFRLSAAGRDSPEMLRLRAGIAEGTGLADDPDTGDLVIRVRRTTGGPGWDVLLRLTARPLSARPWRVVAFDAASNATIAAAMVRATEPAPTDSFIDLMCGSGTIVIERLAAGPAQQILGCDSSAAALELAQQNLRAAKIRGPVRTIQDDARHLGHLGRTFDKLVVNLPWGTNVGSHEENETLYPDVLRSSAEIAVPGARFAVLTHEVRLLERVLAHQRAWHVEQVWRVFQKGHHPRLHLLRRTEGRQTA